jgi:hypothetical protein
LALRASLRACQLLHDSAAKIRRKFTIRPAGELLPFQHIEAKSGPKRSKNRTSA